MSKVKCLVKWFDMSGAVGVINMNPRGGFVLIHIHEITEIDYLGIIEYLHVLTEDTEIIDIPVDIMHTLVDMAKDSKGVWRKRLNDTIRDYSNDENNDHEELLSQMRLSHLEHYADTLISDMDSL